MEGVSRQIRNDALVFKHWGVFVDVGVDYRGFKKRHGHKLDAAELEILADMIEKQGRVENAD